MPRRPLTSYREAMETIMRVLPSAIDSAFREMGEDKACEAMDKLWPKVEEAIVGERASVAASVLFRMLEAVLIDGEKVAKAKERVN
jgi:hypothetical protein